MENADDGIIRAHLYWTGMNTRHINPDLVGLSLAQEMQERLHPAVLGSRAAGDHRPDSDVELMAVCPDEAAVLRADEILRQLLEGKYEVPVVNVITIPRARFSTTAPNTPFPEAPVCSA